MKVVECGHRAPMVWEIVESSGKIRLEYCSRCAGFIRREALREARPVPGRPVPRYPGEPGILADLGRRR